MPYWNRFDICEAWYRFARDYHSGQGSTAYEVFGRLAKRHYQPGLAVESWDIDSDNVRAIYDRLVSGESTIRPRGVSYAKE